MEAQKDEGKLKKAIVKSYKEEINVLKNIKRIVVKLDDQIDRYTNQLQDIEILRKRVEDKLANKKEVGESVINANAKAEITELEIDYEKNRKKFQKYREDIDNRISEAIQKLHENVTIQNTSGKKKKSFKNYFNRWINTIQGTYAEIYNV